MQREKYINVTPESLIEDELFLDWVLRQQPEAKMFWEELIQNHPNEEKAILKAKDFVLSLNHSLSKESIRPLNPDELWEKINAKTQSKIRFFIPSKWMVAAGILFILSIFFLFPKGSKIIKTEKGEIVQIELPDASQVLINSASQISYSDRQWKEEKTVHLEGEAYFEVIKGQKFTVTTPHGSIAVLGTSFNIHARNDFTVVDCFSGRVAVIDQEGNRSIILPGQKIIVDYTGLSEVEMVRNQENVLAWRSGMVYLRESTLKSAIQELQWYFPVEIQASDAILSRPIEGFFKTSHLDSALFQITMPLNLEFEKLSNGIILIKEK